MSGLFEMIQKEQKKSEMLEASKGNEYLEKFGLSLTEEDTEALVTAKAECMKVCQRMELDGSILKELIRTFSDSDYLTEDTLVDTLSALVELFFNLRNDESCDLTDSELLLHMRKLYDAAEGDTDLMLSIDLDNIEDTDSWVKQIMNNELSRLSEDE